MILISIIVVILLSIASIAKAIMDVVDFKFGESIFSDIKNEKRRYWWNQSEGWKNKYKDRDSEKGPAFWGSTTFFVWLTDSWHFFQMIKLTCYDLSIIIPIIILSGISFWWIIPSLIVMKILKGSIFELFWSKIFIKK